MYLASPGVEAGAGDGAKAGVTAPASLGIEVGAGAMKTALLGALTHLLEP